MILAAPDFGRETNLSGHLSDAGQAIAPVYALVEVLNGMIARNMHGKYAAVQHGFCPPSVCGGRCTAMCDSLARICPDYEVRTGAP